MTSSGIDTTRAVINPIDRTLGHILEELSQNLTLSFFSSSVFWTEPTQYCNITFHIPRNRNIYSYNARNLLLLYAIALFASLLVVLVGAWALWTNSTSHSMSFSDIVQTARNPTLDELVHSRVDGCDCMGTLPISKSFERTKLRYG